MATSKDFETRGVAWKYTEIRDHIPLAECVFLTDPGKMFVYPRLDFDKHVSYPELRSSDESRVDASKERKASWSSTTGFKP